MANKSFRQDHLTVQHSGEVIPDAIPTTTVKKAKIEATMDTDTIRSSMTPSPGSAGLLTYLHLSTNAEKTTYALTDRGGTFDIFYLGTAATANGETVTLQGNWKQPIHVIQGSFNIYNAGAGSYAGGSFITAWEIVKK